MSSFPPELPPGSEGALAAFRIDGSAAAPRLNRSPAPVPPAPLARQWQALHRGASAVASLGGMPPEVQTADIRLFPERVADTTDWRAGLARQGVADLAAVMEPGLTALIAVHARGADPAPAARALLQEFTDARNALLAMVAGMGDVA